VMCRNNLKQLDEITAGLRRRLLPDREAEAEQARDSENAVPHSTSSAFMTIGTTVPSGTWELQSTLHGSDHITPDTLTSTTGSTATADSVSELMRRTLDGTDSHSTYIKDLSHTLPAERNHAFSVDADVDVRNSPRDDTNNCNGNVLFHDGKPEEQNSETRTSTDVDRYTDSLKSAQVLLQRLNEMTAFSGLPPAVAANHREDSPTAGDFEEDVMLEDDDTLANIWALRQSARFDEDDNASVHSALSANEHEESYVAPRALNDVESNRDDGLSASSRTANNPGGRGDAGNLSESESDGNRQPTVGCSGESGDTWFIDTQDLRAIDSMAAPEIRQRLQEDAATKPLDADEAAEVRQVIILSNIIMLCLLYVNRCIICLHVNLIDIIVLSCIQLIRSSLCSLHYFTAF